MTSTASVIIAAANRNPVYHSSKQVAEPGVRERVLGLGGSRHEDR